jgi:leucyl-tRNA synthetase
MENYNPLPIEEKWMSFFLKNQIFKTKKMQLRNFIV